MQAHAETSASAAMPSSAALSNFVTLNNSVLLPNSVVVFRGMHAGSVVEARPDIFYHGTSIEAAMQIQARGFDMLRSGTGAGNLLGKGL